MTDSMKTKARESSKEKRKYIKPEIEIIELDNEISLVMGTPPSDPPGKSLPDNDNDDNTFMNPFKMQNF